MVDRADKVEPNTSKDSFWLADGARKPMFDYERMLYKTLLEPDYLNSTPSLRSDDPPSLNVCQSIPRASIQKYKSLGKYSFLVRAGNTNMVTSIIRLSSISRLRPLWYSPIMNIHSIYPSSSIAFFIRLRYSVWSLATYCWYSLSTLLLVDCNTLFSKGTSLVFLMSYSSDAYTCIF